MPFVFAPDYFQSGIAAKVLRLYVEEPLPYLDDAMKKKMATVQSDLLRKFTDVAFDESSKVRWQESQRAEPDNFDGVSVAETHFQKDLFKAPGNPF